MGSARGPSVGHQDRSRNASIVKLDSWLSLRVSRIRLSTKNLVERLHNCDVMDNGARLLEHMVAFGSLRRQDTFASTVMRQFGANSYCKTSGALAALLPSQPLLAASSPSSSSSRGFSSTSSAEHPRHRQTQQLANTPFNAHSFAKTREKLFRNRTTDALYQWQHRNRKYSDGWVLQDPPTWPINPTPLRHAFNKVLKDVVNRYHLLKGKKVSYRIGWHLHGLPIETKLVGDPDMAGITPQKRDPIKIAAKARSSALRQVGAETNEMQLFGIMTDWSEPYDTGKSLYESKQLQVFAEIVRKGLVFRSERPVLWSPWTHTAMAEGETYQDDVLVTSFFVFCPFEPSKSLLAKLPKEAHTALTTSRVSALVYTTKPWSLVGNMALAVNPEMTYNLVEMTEPSPHQGAKFWVAADRMAWLSQRKIGLTAPGSKSRPLVGSLKVLAVVAGRDLLDSKYRSPLQSFRSSSRPIFDASFVDNKTDTGLRHIAPAHDQDSFDLCVAKGLIAPPSGPPLTPAHSNGPYIDDSPGQRTYQELSSPIDSTGCFRPSVAAENPLLHELAGKFAVGAGTTKLRELLWDSGHLMSDIHIHDSVPCDWCMHKRLIMRATHQWFIDLESIKPKAREALAKVRFFPESSRATLDNIVQGRREWCISRQRSWGVPLPVLYDAETQEPLLTADNVMHIASIFKRHGSVYWWQGKPEEFVAPQYRQPGKEWIKSKDTMDVWFDSGSAWAASDTSPNTPNQRDQGIADVCIEDVDQQRGWMQSSLWIKTAYDPEDAEPTAPYKIVAFHGHVNDRRGDRMEETTGRIIFPSQIVTGEGVKAAKQPGVGGDVFRYMVAKISNWGTDSRVSHLVSKHAHADVFVHRRSIQFLLSYLPPPKLISSLEDSEVQAGLTLLDRFILHELYLLQRSCTESYESLDLPSIGRKTLDFDNKVLTPLYLDIIKTTLQNASVNSPRRKAAIAVVDQLLRTITSILAPILPHMAEEVWHFRRGAKKDPKFTLPDQSIPDEANREPSFFHEPWQSVSSTWLDPSSQQTMQRVWELRRVVLDMLAKAQENTWARKTRETQLTIQIDQDIIRSELDPPSQQLLAILDKHTATEELEDWLLLAKFNWPESVPLANLPQPTGTVEQERPKITPGDGAASIQWTLKAWLPLHNKDGTKATGLRLIMQASGKANCPRCRIARSEDMRRVCEKCENAMNDMGMVGGRSVRRAGAHSATTGESDEQGVNNEVEEAEESKSRNAP